MPVPSNISELSTTPANNSPAGTETPGTADDYLRTHAAFIATLNAADVAHVAAADPHHVYALETDVSATLANYAPLASPAMTGTPTAPTAAAGTNTTQVATTEFVQGAKPSDATQAEMEAGTEAAIRGMSPLRVAQAIAAKTTGGAIGGRGQVFTGSGTFTVPTGVTAVKVRGCGGGAGIPISVSNGGTTSFGSYCSATGGSASERSGGTATGGDLNITGGSGGYVTSGTSSTGGAVGGADGGSTTAASTVLPRPSGLLGIYGCGNSGTSGGGGAGGYFERYITGLTPGASITVTIGAAGTGAGAGICIVEW